MAVHLVVAHFFCNQSYFVTVSEIFLNLISIYLWHSPCCKHWILVGLQRKRSVDYPRKVAKPIMATAGATHSSVPDLEPKPVLEYSDLVCVLELKDIDDESGHISFDYEETSTTFQFLLILDSKTSACTMRRTLVTLNAWILSCNPGIFMPWNKQKPWSCWEALQNHLTKVT